MKSKALMLSAKGVVLAERLEPAGFRVGCSDDSFISENLGMLMRSSIKFHKQ